MIQEVEKSPKVALCRACYGTGKVKKVVEYPTTFFTLPVPCLLRYR